MLTIILKTFSNSFETFLSAMLCCLTLQKFYLDFNITVTDSFCFETLKLCLVSCFFVFIYYFAIYISYVIFIFLSGLFILLLISWFSNDSRFIKFFLTSINFDEHTPITSNFKNLVFLTYIFGTASFIFNQIVNSLFN
ncbi:hypothetical protein HERIO_1950 [Hepatospora eriocheir]|uniref:Uncharacterized protein n=1 Tax=Hepatospora eriocheir TaxID=1081669 RepID=A0A1X0Q8R1_9MICR|nr:hypothetical protein HERIO_1950 [Hepatospora eriocheir]